MDATSYLREDMRWAHELQGLVMEDATQTQLDWIPPGIANPMGATYAHAIGAEDYVVNVFLRGGGPLFDGSWRGRTGISEPQLGADPAWSRRVKVDLPKAREYAQAVHAASDLYMSSLSDEDLDKIVDLSAKGYGEKTVAWILSELVVSHIHNMSGELSALKGLQGVKGYPF